eukprot:Selendium_serpulae@DN5212_c0_g1_i10.p1
MENGCEDDGGGEWQTAKPRQRRTPPTAQSHSGSNPVTLNDEPEKVFRNAVTKVFQDWTVIRLAVDHGWGGRKSREKRDALVTQTFDWLVSDRFANLESAKARDHLADFLSVEVERLFHTEIEDDSDFDVAELLLDLRTTCQRGDFNVAQRVFSQAVGGLSSSVGHSVPAESSGVGGAPTGDSSNDDSGSGSDQEMMDD